MAYFSLHTLAPAPGSKKNKTRVGRGHAAGQGKTAGRGTKGQLARTGKGRLKLKRLGMRHQILQTPKLRGFRSAYDKDTIVTLTQLAKKFPAGGEITPAVLVQAGLAKIGQQVKILSNGEVTKKLVVKGCEVSAGAKKKIVAAGGSIA